MTPYRWDTVDVIGQALERSAAGEGVRRIAATLGRPETTVREWCRRFGRVATEFAAALLAEAIRIGWSSFDLPTAPRPRAAAAVAALASAWRRRHGSVGAWRVAALVTGGAFLAPNTDSPLAPSMASSLMARTPQTIPGGDLWPAILPKHSPSGGTT